MKKIVIAPDKFKGSLSGIEFCNAVERGIKKQIENVTIVKLPLADGGDGTVDALKFYTGGKLIAAAVHDPLLRPIQARYLYAENEMLAFIEMAEASGVRLLKNNELNPLETSTYGTGELILDAINRGAKHILLGIGGSATNDAGMGMACALGFRFFDAENNLLEGRGKDLNRLTTIDTSMVNTELRNIKFEVACDVDNPLFGPKGAAPVYAPQKGATKRVVEELDAGLRNFNEKVETQFGKNLQNIAGAGAAGGLGAGCVLFLNAELKSGTELIKSIANFDEQVKDADWIVTGEGKFDEQTFSGKVIKGVLDSRTNQQLAVFCGLSELTAEQIAAHKIDYLAEIIQQASGVEDSIKNAGKYLEEAAAQFAANGIVSK
ncbi:glycerate kinase [Draconibacterium orientale]|uniref:Glycerate kinase n=1 Tax=Draconibacterium orientale TaxID=1168034 RepID=X5E060_9BACT|nr:glycerate kinase [Draconibacterium orientale]AHW60865.1 glycerate kinase [Draconibacterium orientale]SES66341.1 glycerate kinase [Draconibacterium orientale]